jgi:hypothetical protein
MGGAEPGPGGGDADLPGRPATPPHRLAWIINGIFALVFAIQLVETAVFGGLLESGLVVLSGSASYWMRWWPWASRRRSDDLLHNILPDEITGRLKGGKADDRRRLRRCVGALRRARAGEDQGRLAMETHLLISRRVGAPGALSGTDGDPHPRT